MGLINHTNSDLLSLLSNAAPTAKSSAISADTSQMPVTGSFHDLLLLFPSTNAVGVEPQSLVEPESALMLPTVPSASESLLMVTPTDHSSLRLFSQDGSLYAVQHGQQKIATSSLSELERLEQAVAELQTVTLYVPPETRISSAIAPTAPNSVTQLPESGSETSFENISAGETQPTIGNVVSGLKFSPTTSAPESGTATDLRTGTDAGLSTDSDAVGIGHAAAAQVAFTDPSAVIPDVIVPPWDSEASAPIPAALNSVPGVLSGKPQTNPADTVVELTKERTVENPVTLSSAESAVQRHHAAPLPEKSVAAGLERSPAIPTISGEQLPSASTVSGLAGIGESVSGISFSSATESSVQVTGSQEKVPALAAASHESTTVVTAVQQSSPEIPAQSMPASDKAISASITAPADHRPQPIPAADSAATEKLDSDSEHASAGTRTELQGLTDKADGRASSQGDGRQQQPPHTALPPVRGETSDAVASALVPRGAATDSRADVNNLEQNTTPVSADLSSATTIGQGLTESAAAVVPDVFRPALHGILNPLEIAEQLANEVSRRVETSVVDGQERFTLRLDPPELGELVISMRRTAAGIELHVEAADPATMNLIQNGIDQLKGDPERSGSVFQQMHIDVTTSGHGSGHSGDHRRSSSLNGAAERATVDRSENIGERSESRQISFVA